MQTFLKQPAKRIIQRLCRDFFEIPVRRAPIPPLPDNPRLLIWLVPGLGNVVMTVPLLRNLRQCWPQAYIQVIGKQAFWPVLKAEGVDSLWEEENDWLCWWKILENIRNSRFNAALVCRPGTSFRKAFGLYLAGVPRRIIHKEPDCPVEQDFSFFYTHRISIPVRYHDVQANVDLLCGLDLPPVRVARFPSNPKFSKQLSPLITIHPGSKNSESGQAKRWPIDHFAALMSELVRIRQARFLVVEGPDEADCGQTLVREFPHNSQLLKGLPLDALSDQLRHTDYFIANDSGIAHLAAWLGVPGTVLFGPQDPALCEPWGESIVSVEADVECHPCWDRFRSPAVICPYEFKCMHNMRVERVLQKVLHAFESIPMTPRAISPTT